MTAQVFWGHDYSSTVLKFFVYALTFSVTPLFGLVGYWLDERCREHNGATSLLEAALSIPGNDRRPALPRSGRVVGRLGVDRVAAVLASLR